MTNYVMDELANIERSKIMERKEELERKIKHQKEMIEDTKKRNPNSGDLSFDEYQLWCLEKELEEINSLLENMTIS